MSNLIDDTYFILDANIPNAGEELSTADEMTTRYERVILTEVLGATLYNLMIASPTDAIYKRIIEPNTYEVEYMGETHKVYWNGLTNTNKVSLIAYYVYVKWVSNRVTMTVTTGEIKPVSENSEQAPVSAKISYAWRLMSDLIGSPYGQLIDPTLYNLLTFYKDDYPTWLFEDVGRVNSWDL